MTSEQKNPNFNGHFPQPTLNQPLPATKQDQTTHFAHLFRFDAFDFANRKNNLKQWGVQDSNLRRHSQQIYSLSRLTASVTPQKPNALRQKPTKNHEKPNSACNPTDP